MKKTIMIADDDKAILESVRMILELEGYEVKTSMNGKELYDPLFPLPDVLLLDIWMSGIDGRDICRYIKHTYSSRVMPIIMFSASRDIQQSAKEAGADDFIAKPFDIDDLITKIKLNIH